MKRTNDPEADFRVGTPACRLGRIMALLATALAVTTVGLARADDFNHQTITIKKDKFKVGKGGKAEPLAAISGYCLGCHGPDATEAPQPSHSVGGAGRSHPVDVDYPFDRPGYAPAGGLDPRLRLVEGNLACITCHDVEAPDHRPVLPLDQSQICVACHVR